MKRYILLSAVSALFFCGMNFGMQEETKSRCIVSKPLTIEDIVQQYIKRQCRISNVVINGKQYIIKQKLNSSAKNSLMKMRQGVPSAVGQCIYEEGELLLFKRSEKMHKASLLTFQPGKPLKKILI